MNVNGGKPDNNVEVWLYNDGNDPSCKWYLTQAFHAQNAPLKSEKDEID